MTKFDVCAFGDAPSNQPQTSRQKCIQSAQAKYNQTRANIQASHTTNLKEGAVAGFVTGVIGNCITGAVVGAAVPIVSGVAAWAAPVTGVAGCAANAFILSASNNGPPSDIDPQPFIALLFSGKWTHRNKSSLLFRLTESGDLRFLSTFREKAMQPLIEAAW